MMAVTQVLRDSSSESESAFGGSYEPKKVEDLVRRRWNEIKLRERIDARLQDKKKKGYVDGPPTLNGEPHMGHLRGRLIKDLWFRYETMRGTNIDFRGGWDTQGLPVELQAEKELGLTGNKTANLKIIGEEKLVQACKNMISKYHHVWTNADALLGLLIDDSKSYYTYKDQYIEREWQIVRAASDQGILDESFRVTPFCPSCQTPLSASEVALGGYENLEDPSMYFKMRIRGTTEPTFLIAWTTMPFTVVTDELVGAKPDADYSYVSVTTDSGQETWLVGKERLDAMMGELHVENYAVKSTVKGKDIEGTRYEHPLADVIPAQAEFDQKSPLVHSIVAEDYVDTSTGSGLVHMAPANGEDDFEVSRKRNVPVFNPIDGEAKFTSDAGHLFAGLFVRDADEKVRDALKERGSLLRYGRLKHEYPVCWRSGDRLVWLARREYYYFVDRLGEKAVDAASKVEYYYEAPKNRFLEIIKEKHPWCISRERVWGTPLPIWKCGNCGKKLGLFSRKEIVEHASSLPDGENFELHRPWIDRIVVQCPDCKQNMTREPFVLDTWHNSGSAPYSSFTDEEYKEYVPVPFLTEGIDQTRGWAYTLLIENVILQKKDVSPYYAFLFQGLVLDEKGSKMSKSKGNYIAATDLMKERSVDVVRLYLLWKAGPIDSINFSYKELETRPYQILNTLYHMHVFYLQNSRFDGFAFGKSSDLVKTLRSERKKLAKQDAWLLSRLEFLIAFSTGAYSSAKYHESARAVEQFLIEDLSQTYVPIIRGEMWQEDEEGKKRRATIYSVLGLALLTCSKILHPISPFLTDYLASESFGVEALTLEEWPGSMPEMRDERLEVEFDLVAKLVSLTNNARMKGKLKRRWPLRKAQYLVSKDSIDLIHSNKNILLEQCNVQDLSLEDDPSKLPLTITAKLNLELVAPRAKRSLKELQYAVASSDPVALYNQMADKGKVMVGDFELGPADLQFFFASREPKTVVAENYGMVVALDSERNDPLIAQGLVKDLARNLQSLRKEKGYNPTDVLALAQIAGLGEQNISLLKDKESEIAFLVRSKAVKLCPDLPKESENWREVDIDGTKVKIDIA